MEKKINSEDDRDRA